MLQEQKKINSAIRFLFPFYPIKILKSTKMMLFIAVMLALRLIFQWISIPIPAFGFAISIAWVPVMVLGWYFGPILGLFLGFLCDTLGYLFSPTGIWFWMYAIQEPCVAMIAGVFAGIAHMRISKTKASILTDVIITQLILICFATISYLVLISWISNPDIEFKGDNGAGDSFYNVYKWIALGLFSAFFIMIEILTFSKFKEKRNNPKKFTLLLYTNCVVILSILIFGFALSPIITVEYLYYIGLNPPAGYLEYGSLFYLIPRVAVDSIKVPIECAALCSIILCLNPGMEEMMSSIKNQWK